MILSKVNAAAMLMLFLGPFDGFAKPGRPEVITDKPRVNKLKPAAETSSDNTTSPEAFVKARNPITLHIGDKAPALKYAKWIKGNPVKALKGDQLYILEFWATWCGPCNAAMPHLTKTQKDYGDKINIIGVGVRERVKEGEAYESTLPMVEKFVNANGARMGYSVIADNNEQYMYNNWLKAAGLRGIPSTFIVKDEQIIWIGHPMKLDSTLHLITNGTYNMNEYKSAFDKNTEQALRQSEGERMATERVNDALKAQDYNRAFEMMELGKKEHPNLEINMNIMKFETLLKNASEKEAIVFAGEWARTSKYAHAYVLGSVSEVNGLSKETYLWAARDYLRAFPPPVSSPYQSHVIAAVYAKGGDYKNAIIYEKIAIEGAKAMLKDRKIADTENRVAEYEQTLAGYKKVMQTVKN